MSIAQGEREATGWLPDAGERVRLFDGRKGVVLQAMAYPSLPWDYHASVELEEGGVFATGSGKRHLERMPEPPRDPIREATRRRIRAWADGKKGCV